MSLAHPLTVALVAAVSPVALTSTLTIPIPIRLANADADPLAALMMGGTGQPTPSPQWMNTIISDFISPATGTDYTGTAVTTPESAPIVSSVQKGLTDLQAAVAQQQATDAGQPFLIEGYSQSALIAVDLKEELAAAHKPASDITLALLGSGNRPNGGIFERLDGLYVPGLQVDANGAEPTDLGIATVDIAAQYDGFADFPQYPIDLLADLNAFFGIKYVHSAYGDATTPMTGPFTDQYVEGSTETVKQVTPLCQPGLRHLPPDN